MKNVDDFVWCPHLHKMSLFGGGGGGFECEENSICI